MTTFYLFVGLAMLLLATFGWKRFGIDARLVADRSVPYQFAGLWMATAFTWGTTYLYTSTLAYEHGVFGLAVFMIGNTAGLLTSFWLVLQVKNPGRTYTNAQVMSERYDSKTGLLYSLSTMGVQSLYALPLQFLVVSGLFSIPAVLGISPDISIPAAALFMVGMMAIGGMKSSLLLDVIKFVMMAVLIFYIAPKAVMNAGDVNLVFGNMVGTLQLAGQTSSQWFLSAGMALIISLVSAGAIDQALFQRYFSVKQGPRRTVLLFMVFGAVFFVLNMVASGALGLLAANADLAVTITKSNISGFDALLKFAPSLAMVFIGLVIASFVASGDAALNASSSIFVNDIYARFRPTATEREKKLVHIGAGSLLVIPAVLIARSGISLITLTIMVGVFRSALLIPTIVAFRTPKSTIPNVFGAILAAMVVGIATYGTGMYCGQKGMTCNLPFFSASEYVLIGTLSGIVVTGVYCLVVRWMNLKSQRLSSASVQRG